MSEHSEYGVMHPDGRVIETDNSRGYPFASRRMAAALARDLDDDCGDCVVKGKHAVMRRTISDWITT